MYHCRRQRSTVSRKNHNLKLRQLVQASFPHAGQDSADRRKQAELSVAITSRLHRQAPQACDELFCPSGLHGHSVSLRPSEMGRLASLLGWIHLANAMSHSMLLLATPVLQGNIHYETQCHLHDIADSVPIQVLLAHHICPATAVCRRVSSSRVPKASDGSRTGRTKCNTCFHLLHISTDKNAVLQVWCSP